MAATMFRQIKLNHQEEIIGLLLKQYEEQDKEQTSIWAKRDIV